jgi:pyrroline-5-carboxylate reductase
MTYQPSADHPMLLFGCGNMGRAMLDGWLAAKWDPAAFVVVDPYADGLAEGVVHYRTASEVDRQFSTALLAIKPQMVRELAGDFELLLAPEALVISILAGPRTLSLQAYFPGRKILRLMPNLAAAIGKSPLGLFAATNIEKCGVESLLAPLGVACWLTNEDQMDAVTALAGSGPAFVYRYIDALTKAGAQLGLDPGQSLELARMMVLGAAELATISMENPEELARRVTSPGGTTAAGLAVLDDGGALQKLIEATLRAARDRGIALSQPTE